MAACKCQVLDKTLFLSAWWMGVLTWVPLLHIPLVLLRVCGRVEGACKRVAQDAEHQQIHPIGGQAKLQLQLPQSSLSGGNLRIHPSVRLHALLCNPHARRCMSVVYPPSGRVHPGYRGRCKHATDCNPHYAGSATPSGEDTQRFGGNCAIIKTAHQSPERCMASSLASTIGEEARG